MSFKVVHKKWLGIDISKKNIYTPSEQTAKLRLKIVTHYSKYGLASCLDAFDVSQRSLYRWKKILELSHGDWRCLIPKSTTRIKRNTRYTHPEILKLIQRERFKQIVGKAKLSHLIKLRCKELGIPTISQSTIARILISLKSNKQIPSYNNITYNAAKGTITKRDKPKRTKERRGEFLPLAPGDLVQIDTVELRIHGRKRYTINVIDIFTRLTYSKAFTKLNSDNAKTTVIDAQKQLGFEFKRVQTDNGLEFYKHFDQYLEQNNITHFWNYPKCPKMNAYVERFNRTIQEELLYRVRSLLEYDITYINKTILPQYQNYYNKQRLHQGLDYKTPYQYYLDYQSGQLELPNVVD